MTRIYTSLLENLDPNALFFTKEDTTIISNDLLVNLVRNFFSKEKITNKDYIKRYYQYYQDKMPDATNEVFIQKAAADRRFIRNPDKITLNMAKNVLEAMGYKIDEIQLVVTNTSTGDNQIVSSKSLV